ncbi:MAG: rhamnulokinase family protein [Bryobacteraceae bacterium]|nr:rhamnulokinase family protein [Bryobacteraceae bacterium]
MKRFLGFDLGAESGRAMLGEVADGKLRLEEIHRFPNQPVRLPTGLYWDTLRLYWEMQEGLRIATRERKLALSGIGVDAWGVDFALLGRDGALVDNPRHYRDARNNGQLQRTFAIVPQQEIYAETGLQFMQINSLFQWHAMKLAGSPALDTAETLLFIPDLFNYWFTGVKRAELTIASTSQFYNPVKKRFAADMLERLGLNPRLLPEIVNPGSRLGEHAGVPVYAVAGHDTAAAVAAVPAQGGEDWCYVSSGTWSLMGVELPDPVINARSAALNFTNEIGVEGRVRLLRNIAGLWLWQECRRDWALAGHHYSYDEMTRMAEQARPFASVIHPDAFLEPDAMPEQIAAHCRKNGQPVPQTHGEYCRVILEGLALRYRQVLENLAELTGRRLTRIHIVGGGSRNQVLNRFVAGATGRPVYAGPAEATAAGNILVQAMGAGLLKNLEEARAMVTASFPVTIIEPGSQSAWDEAYAVFTKLNATR